MNAIVKPFAHTATAASFQKFALDDDSVVVENGKVFFGLVEGDSYISAEMPVHPIKSPYEYPAKNAETPYDTDWTEYDSFEVSCTDIATVTDFDYVSAVVGMPFVLTAGQCDDINQIIDCWACEQFEQAEKDRTAAAAEPDNWGF